LLESPYAFSKLIVADFGMAKELSNMCETMQTRCGTFTYMAPEIINSSRYSKEVDCW
jgi:serine/threonine-protein kinase Chk2